MRFWSPEAKFPTGARQGRGTFPLCVFFCWQRYISNWSSAFGWEVQTIGFRKELDKYTVPSVFQGAEHRRFVLHFCLQFRCFAILRSSANNSISTYRIRAPCQGVRWMQDFQRSAICGCQFMEGRTTNFYGISWGSDSVDQLDSHLLRIGRWFEKRDKDSDVHFDR